jgi:hypothetical protein
MGRFIKLIRLWILIRVLNEWFENFGQTLVVISYKISMRRDSLF